jgi:putative transposase
VYLGKLSFPTEEVLERLIQIQKRLLQDICVNGLVPRTHMPHLGKISRVHFVTFANNLKTVSSRLIRKEFPDKCAKYFHKPVFWKIGYFVSSTGGASLKTIKRYIQQQDSPGA